MAVDYLDLEIRPVDAPLPAARPEPVQPAPVTPVVSSGVVSSGVVSSGVVSSGAERVVDLTDHSPSYWVRRRRAQAALEGSR